MTKTGESSGATILPFTPLAFSPPFIHAVKHVITTMTKIEVQVGEPHNALPEDLFGDITGILGMSSADYAGNMLIRFEAGAILQVVSAMLFEKFSEINQDVIDAVGEITNMIVGAAKREFEPLGQSFNMATPAVINGSDVFVPGVGQGGAIIIPFSIPNGRFSIEIAFESKRNK